MLTRQTGTDPQHRTERIYASSASQNHCRGQLSAASEMVSHQEVTTLLRKENTALEITAFEMILVGPTLRQR